MTCPVAKLLVPEWEDIVDSGIGLSYRPARLHRLSGRYVNLCQTRLYPQPGTKGLASVPLFDYKYRYSTRYSKLQVRAKIQTQLKKHK